MSAGKRWWVETAVGGMAGSPVVWCEAPVGLGSGQRVTVMPSEDAELLVKHAQSHSRPGAVVPCSTTCELCPLLSRINGET